MLKSLPLGWCHTYTATRGSWQGAAILSSGVQQEMHSLVSSSVINALASVIKASISPAGHSSTTAKSSNVWSWPRTARLPPSSAWEMSSYLKREVCPCPSFPSPFSLLSPIYDPREHHTDPEFWDRTGFSIWPIMSMWTCFFTSKDLVYKIISVCGLRNKKLGFVWKGRHRV